MTWLNNIRSKSKSARRHILNVSIFTLGVIIFILWAVTLPYRFTDTKQTNTAESLKPLTIIKDSITNTYQDTKESIDQFNYGQ